MWFLQCFLENGDDFPLTEINIECMLEPECEIKQLILLITYKLSIPKSKWLIKFINEIISGPGRQHKLLKFLHFHSQLIPELIDHKNIFKNPLIKEHEPLIDNVIQEIILFSFLKDKKTLSIDISDNLIELNSVLDKFVYFRMYLWQWMCLN